MNDRVSELENRIRELKEELAQKSDFISIMVHQLRTPLSAVQWVFKMMLDGDLGNISETQKKIVVRGLASSKEMIHLLADVSDANHASTWVLHLQPQPMDIVSCIKGTLEEFAEEAMGKNITLSFSQDKPLPQVMADPRRICIVIQNLIENAIKYNKPGGTVTVYGHMVHNQLVVTVRDEGIGIPEEEQGHIFQKFFRAQNAQEKKGTGLGLYVAKQIVEGHHGSIWFESNPGIGTTFFVSLPIVE